MNYRSFLILMCWVIVAAVFLGVDQGRAAPALTPGVDYSVPNFAYSPPMKKFVNSLPGLAAGVRPFGTALGTNNLGQYMPIAVPDKTSYPGCDYYEIALVDYREQMHSDLPAIVGSKMTGTGGTQLRGYVQIYPPGTVPPGTAVPLQYPDGTPILVGGNPVYAHDNPHYLGPMILATKDVPTRVKFYNLLPLGSAGNYFIPVDTTLNGAGNGPKQIGVDSTGLPIYEQYTQNRSTIHLHGGLPPWISDGTALQWITPAGEATSYTNGASFQNVPDMPIPPNGSATFYWPNQQSGRLMFYHDHAVGITRMVYAGIAAGYLIVDPAEENALAAAGVPGTLGATPDLVHMIPLVIQDKTYVPDATTLAAIDPLWDTNKWGGLGNLWFPHVYMPNQDPSSDNDTGANPLGRWDYGPWFWPPWPVPAGSTPPLVSTTPEAFMDTPVVNGTAYPYMDVQPQAYRLHILNACNDRMLNLQWYVAEPLTVSVTNGGVGYSTKTIVTIAAPAGGGAAAQARATVVGGVITAITVTNAGAGYVVNERPVVTITDVTGTGAGALASALTDVAMVEACPDPAIPFPTGWLAQTPGMIPEILDSRPGGVPDPRFRGPAMIQIGTEGGLLPNPALLLNTPVGYEQNKRNIVVLNVSQHTLFLAAAERADVIVDFTPYAGKTLILYNDSPAPVPAGDPRCDFYTGDPDFSITGGANYQGGAPSTRPGYGPNTRTIMQFRVGGTPSATPLSNDYYNATLLTSLQTKLPAAFKQFEDPPVVPESVYNTAYPPALNTYSRIQNTSLTFTPYGTNVPITMQMLPKAIQELFDPLGRMNATLGVELPFTSALIQTTIPLGFTDPATEIFNDGETQLWKITHNGVDTHGIHFHLVNVQVVNRVGWDGAIRPPDSNETGWKDTVRMNPLEDIIVAMRAKTPKFPFGVPNCVRPLNPALPLNSSVGFEQVDPLTGNPMAVSNVVANFGWEYTWHCHILGHEENDMMRPVVLNYTAVVPDAPSNLVGVLAGAQVNLAWTDPTPVANPTTPGNPKNEIGFRIERANVVSGVPGTFGAIGLAIANATNYVDTTIVAGLTYSYRVVAYNAAGSATSAPVTVGPPTTPATVIVDNGDGPASVTIVGTWTPSIGAPGYWSTNFLHDGNVGKGTKSVRFTPNLPAGGLYQVAIWYAANPNRSTHVPVDIVSATGTNTVTVNQRVNGGQWVVLGTNTFVAGTSGSVLIRTTGTTDGYVIADAVRFVPVVPDVIVDNGDGPASVTIVGTWTPSIGAPGYWSTNFLHDGNVGKGTKSVRFTPNLPAGGLYQVAIWYAANPNRSTHVPVDIVSATGTNTVTVNQRVNGGLWVVLGTNTFVAGTSGSVLIRTTGTTDGYVIADAARFTKR